MSSPRAIDPRRTAAAFSLLLLLALVLPARAFAAEAKAVRTDAGDLGGYTAEAEGAPLSMLMYEPVIPVPVDPGEPHGEGSLSYTKATVETGPVSRGVASSFWPGPAVGDGFATLCDQVTNNPEAPKDMRQECNEEYRLKADARYPSSKQFPQRDGENQVEQFGAGMLAEALGLDTYARASSAESPNEEAMGLGNTRSRSDATVVKGEVLATTVASAEDVALGGGVITIESVKTVLEATADKKTASTSGTTEVNGLVIGGQGYTIDERGLRPVQDDKPAKEGVATLPEMPGAKEMDKQLGVEVELVKHESEVNGADATRTAGGLRISIDTAVLKKALTDNVPVYDVIGQVPPPADEVVAQFAALLALGPEVEFIFGRGQVRAAGTEPMDFDFPDPPPLDDPVAPADTTPDIGSSGTPAVDTTRTGSGSGAAAPPPVAPADTGMGGPAVPSAAGPALAPTQPAPVAATVPMPKFFGGLPPGLVAAGLVLAALGGKLLAGFTTAAMTGITGAICDRGVPRTVPNLRPQG